MKFTLCARAAWDVSLVLSLSQRADKNRNARQSHWKTSNEWGSALRKIWIVTVAVAVTISATALAQSNRNQFGIKQPPAQVTKSERGKEQPQTQQPPIIVNVTPATKTDADRAQEAEEWRNKSETDANLAEYTRELALFTKGLFYATAVLCIATIGLLIAAFIQSRDMKSSIAAAEAANNLNREISVASRRAWVSIEDVKLTHPTKFMEDGIVFCVQATTKNLGHTPATSVWIDFESYFAENNSENFTDAQRRFKDQLRARPVALGQLLFPGDTNIYRQRWADGIEKIKDAIGTRPSGEKRIGFTVFIGLSYRIVGDISPHITYDAHVMLNVPIGTAIQPDQLVDLPREPFLAGEAD